MKRHHILCLLFLAFISCARQAKQDVISNTSQPNIIIILADDLGYETIGADGGSTYNTPHLDRLANEGARFVHCYAQPLCTPSRVKLMTGIYNVRNYVEFGLLHESQTTVGHIFSHAGYETCVVGKWQLGKDPMSPRNAGFNEHCLWQVTEGRVDENKRDTRFSGPVLDTNGTLKTYPDSDYGPDVVSQYGMDFMRKSVASETPFLLYYPMILTHCPFSPTPDSETWATDKEAIQSYKGKPEYFSDMMTYTDKIIGKLVATVNELNIEKNTLIVFVGDNGTDTPIVSTMNGVEIAGAKSKSTDGGTRVPLIVNWPSQISKNQVRHELADLSDILPTVCEAASVDIPDSLTLDGKSFLPLLRGQEGYEARDYVYNWYSRSGKEGTEKVFARNQRYKLYKNGDFFDIEADRLEEHPIATQELNDELFNTYDLLKNVIDLNAEKRLELIHN